MEIPDRSWMQIKDQASIEFEEDIDNFLNYAFGKLGDPNTIRCPCSKCYNVKFKSRDNVKYDLFRFETLNHIQTEIIMENCLKNIVMSVRMKSEMAWKTY